MHLQQAAAACFQCLMTVVEVNSSMRTQLPAETVKVKYELKTSSLRRFRPSWRPGCTQPTPPAGVLCRLSPPLCPAGWLLRRRRPAGRSTALPPPPCSSCLWIQNSGCFQRRRPLLLRAQQVSAAPPRRRRRRRTNGCWRRGVRLRFVHSCMSFSVLIQFLSLLYCDWRKLIRFPPIGIVVFFFSDTVSCLLIGCLCAQERLALPSVCDLFSCMKVGGDKEKWLHKAPVQVSQEEVRGEECNFSYLMSSSLTRLCFFQMWWRRRSLKHLVVSSSSLSPSLYRWSAHTTSAK